MSEPRLSPRLSLVAKAVVAIAISALALWWSFRGVDTEILLADLSQSSGPKLAGYFGAQLVCHLIRVVRWAIVLSPLATVSFRSVFAAASLGFPASFFLPLRLGELVRPMMITRAGVPFAGAMASVVVERIADGLVNLGLFFLYLRLLPSSSPIPDQLQSLATVALVGFGGALGVLVLATLFRNTAVQIFRRVLGPISPKLADKVVGLLSTFTDGILALRSPARIAGFFGLSLAYWLLNGTSTWWLSTSYAQGLPWLAGPFTISVVVFAITIPAGPAFAGTLEAGFKLGLGAFGISASTAVAAAIAVHASTLLLLAGLAGAGLLLAEPNQRRNLRNTPRPAENNSGA